MRSDDDRLARRAGAYYDGDEPRLGSHPDERPGFSWACAAECVPDHPEPDPEMAMAWEWRWLLHCRRIDAIVELRRRGGAMFAHDQWDRL